jgi:hypothetical protein
MSRQSALRAAGTLAFGFAVIVIVALLAPVARAATVTGASAPNSLKYLICDVKRNVAQLSNDSLRLRENNYRQVIDALKDQLGCNGIRLSIVASTAPADIDKIAPDSNPEGYTKLYRDVYRYARQQGLLIYVNVLLPSNKTHVFGYNIPDWIAGVSAYANYFCPDFLGPFGETGAPYPAAYKDIIQSVRKNLTPACTDPFGNKRPAPPIEGPDAAWVAGTTAILNRDSGLAQELDIIGSHANVRERSAVAGDWVTLSKTFGKPVWDSEAENAWSFTSKTNPNKGQQVGLDTVLASNVVSGIVIYNAPFYLNEEHTNGNLAYSLNRRGIDIAAGLQDAGWPVPLRARRGQ